MLISRVWTYISTQALPIVQAIQVARHQIPHVTAASLTFSVLSIGNRFVVDRAYRNLLHSFEQPKSGVYTTTTLMCACLISWLLTFVSATSIYHQQPFLLLVFWLSCSHPCLMACSSALFIVEGKTLSSLVVLTLARPLAPRGPQIPLARPVFRA